jgi:hypothetical protein
MMQNTTRVIHIIGTDMTNKKNPETVLTTVVSCARCKKKCKTPKRCTIINYIKRYYTTNSYNYKSEKPVLQILLQETNKLDNVMHVITKARSMSYQR